MECFLWNALPRSTPTVPCIRPTPCQHGVSAHAVLPLLKKLQNEREICVSEMLFCGKSHLFSSGAIVQFNVPLDVFFWKALAFLVSFCQSFLCYVHIYWLHFLTSLTHFAQAFISIALSKVTKGLSLAKSKGQFLLPLTWLFSNIWHKRSLWILALLDFRGAASSWFSSYLMGYLF